MGSCMSKVPAFDKASISLANGILPETHPGSNMTTIKFVPNQSLMSANVAVYLSTDQDNSPSLFFGGGAGKFKLFKVLSLSDGEQDREELATIAGGMQSSKGTTQYYI